MDDQKFERRGNDIYSSVTISFKNAILGTQVVVSTLTKKVTLRIPPGIQPGTVMRLKGQGLAVGSLQGDLFVKVEVTIPNEITEKQHRLLDEWDE